MILLSTAYFPSISWMALFAQNKEVHIDLYESYQKQSYRNRFHIATSHGLLALSVPVKKPKGNQSKSNEILIDYQQNWQSLHWKSIKTAYQSAPFFLYYQDDIEALIKKKYHSLHEMNEHILIELATLIGISSGIKYTTDFHPINQLENDFRFLIHPKKVTPLDMENYYQIFDTSLGFISNLSVLDLLFNLGPEALPYLESLKLKK